MGVALRHRRGRRRGLGSGLAARCARPIRDSCGSGKISYGLYMYHEVALWARGHAFALLPWFPNNEELITIGTLALTIGLAAASYYGYERRFLELKRRWTRVSSRPV